MIEYAEILFLLLAVLVALSVLISFNRTPKLHIADPSLENEPVVFSLTYGELSALANAAGPKNPSTPKLLCVLDMMEKNATLPKED